MAEELGLQAALVAGGAAVAKGVDWLLSLRKDGRQASHDATAQALEALEMSLQHQQAEITRLAERMQAASEGEERCLERMRRLRDEMHTLRGELQKAGVRIPASSALGAD